MKKQNLILVPNHAESPFDWLAALSFADHLGRIAMSYSLFKRSFLFIPTLGWTGALSGSLALTRKWQIDKIRLKGMFHRMQHDYAGPWFFLIYPEGTRQNPKKLKESQQWARERGFPELKNLLQPRFVFLCLFWLC